MKETAARMFAPLACHNTPCLPHADCICLCIGKKKEEYEGNILIPLGHIYKYPKAHHDPRQHKTLVRSERAS